MQPEALLKAIQMLGVDVANLTTALAMLRGQLDLAQERAKEINTNGWGRPEGEMVQVPMGQYQAIIILLDVLS